MNDNPETTRGRRPGWTQVAIVAIAALAALAALHSIANSDFWLHLAAGRQVSQDGLTRSDPFSFTTAAETRWVQATWLYDWLLYTGWRLGGAPLVVAAHSAAAAAAYALMLTLGRRRAGASALAGLAAIWMAAPQLVIRPTLPALFLAAITIWILHRPWSTGRRLAVLIPAQLLWANLHLTCLLAPLLAALAALDAQITHRRASSEVGPEGITDRARGLLQTAGVLLAATLANPHGLRLHLHALGEFLRPNDAWLIEWISPFASLFDQGWLQVIPRCVLIFIALGFVLHRQRMPVFASVLGVLSAFLIVWPTHPFFKMPLHVEWCALLALPFLALSAEALLDRAENQIPEEFRAGARRLLGGLGGLAVLATAWAFLSSTYHRDSGSAARFGWGVQKNLYPIAAAESLLSSKSFPARVYNLPLDGGALLWARPGSKVLVDARSRVYGTAFLRDLNLALRGDQERWTELARRWPPDAFVFNCCWSGAGGTIRTLLLTRQWSLVYFDGASAVLMPALRMNLPWIRNSRLQQAGLQILEQDRQDYAAALQRGERPPNPPRLIGGAAFLQSLGRFREAGALYGLLARGSPRMTGAWLNLGICLVQQGDAAAAVPVLEYLRGRVPRHVMVHLWLSRAYRETGQAELGDAAFEKALSLDRPVAEAFAGLTRTNAPATTLQDGDRSLR